MISNSDDPQADKRRRARTVAYTELIFVLIPFAFLALDKFSLKIFYNPEWSLAASILFGQTVARFLSGLIKQGVSKNWEFGILYSVIFMALSILSVYTYSKIQNSPLEYSTYTLLQLLLFLSSIVVFVVFGAIGHRLMDMPERQRRIRHKKTSSEK